MTLARLPPIVLRPLRPADRAAYRRAVDALSAKTMYRRFGGPRRRLSEAEVDDFLDMGHHGRDALAACDAATGEIVAVGRFAPADGAAGCAEVALTVGDCWQGLGLGTIVFARVLDLAREAGYRSAHASTLEDNQPVAALLRAGGFDRRLASHGVLEWNRPLEERGPTATWSAGVAARTCRRWPTTGR